MLGDLLQHPPAPPAINWQEFARQHNIPGSNARQVVKEFARKNNIDTVRLDGRQGGTQETPAKAENAWW